MKIIFLCGCLEPGKDGVGDYSRRLAGDLLKKGHQVSLVALNDHFIDTDGELVELQELLPVFRIRGPMTRFHNLRLIEKRIEKLDPEWLSLQYVPFSFNNKGLPVQLAKQLALLGSGRKWHIMFHELWVGQEQEANMKLRLWGFIQKKIIKTMLQRLNPRIIHTQSNLYLDLLRALGYDNSHLLPLFGNIPVPETYRNFGDNSTWKRKKDLTLVLFGSLQPNAPLVDFSKELLEYSKKTNKKIIVSFIGRNGKELSGWLEVFSKINIETNHLGEKSPNEISEVLLKSSIGISTTPIALIEKSGTVASMLEHGLPVLSVARAWTSRPSNGRTHPAGIIEYNKGNLEQDLEKLKNISSFRKNLSSISEEFLKALI